jgi:hypothetical protein
MGNETRPGHRAGGGFAVSRGGTQGMTDFPFAHLGRGMYRPEDCIETRHFAKQAVLRGFSRDDLGLVLQEAHWREDEEQPDCWKLQADRWQVVLGFDGDTPKLITVKWRAEFTVEAA